MSRSFVIPPLALALLLLAPLASAQLSAREEAKARFETGLKYYDARDFESARIAFAQAYAVLQSSNVLLNLARSELYASHPVEALAHFDQVIADSSAPADRRADAKRLREDAFKKTGHIVVKTAPEAALELDGRAIIGPTAVPIHVLPGLHALEARLPAASATKTAKVDARAGETTNVDLTFVPATQLPAAAETAPHERALTTDPVTDPPAERPPEGTFWGWRSVSGLALLGAGAVTLGIGVGFKIDQGTQTDRANALDARVPRDACAGPTVSQDCRDLRTAQETRKNDKTRGDTLVGFGLAGVVAGGVLLATAALWPHRRQASALRVLPLTGPKLGGLMVSSSF